MMLSRLSNIIRQSLHVLLLLFCAQFLSSCTIEAEIFDKLKSIASPSTGNNQGPSVDYPKDKVPPLFQDDFNRADELLTMNIIKWLPFTGGGPVVTKINNQELNSTIDGGQILAMPNISDLSKIYLESSLKMDGSALQSYAIMPYSNLNTYEMIGCFFKYDAGQFKIYAGDYMSYVSQPLTPLITLNNYPINSASYVGCEVDQESGTATAFLNSVALGKAENLSVPAPSDSSPLLLAQGTGVILDNVKGFNSFAEGRAANNGDLRIYNTPYAVYYTNELANFYLQGYCANNGATVQVKDSAPGGYSSAVATCTNNLFAVLLDLSDGIRFPIGANQIRIEYVNSGNTTEYFYNFSTLAPPPPSLVIGSPTPTQGDSSTDFAWPVTFSNAANIYLDDSYVTLSGSTTGCVVTVAGVGSSKVVHVTGCDTISGSIAISVKAGAAANGTGVLSAPVGPSVPVSVANTIMVNFANNYDFVMKGNTANTQQMMITLDKASPVDLTVEYLVLSFFSTAVNPINYNLPSVGTVVIPAGQTTWPISYTYQGSAGYVGTKAIQVGLSSVKGAGVIARIGANQNMRRLVRDEDDGDWVMMSAGSGFTCGVTSLGVAKCWGGNRLGQLGDGTTTDRLVPTAVSGSDTYTMISAGQYHTCGITSAGIAKCWGQGIFGKLGDGTTLDRLVPTTVSGSDTYTMISVGTNYTCGLTSVGIVKCWGSYDMFGDGSFQDKLTPTAISGSDSYTAISAGSGHACGITNTGIVKCWGSNSYGELGDGTTTRNLNPTIISGSDTYTMISAGAFYTCGITSAGIAKCWGQNYSGKVGDGTITDKRTPTTVSGSDTYSMISAGFGHTCGITNSGGVKCWGDNESGKLGDGTSTNRLTPTAISGNDIYTVISAGSGHTCGITSTGIGKCWGANFSKGSAIGSVLTPEKISDSSVYSMISAGDDHACGLTSVGIAKCWGVNYDGRLGDGTKTSRSTSTAVDGSDTYSMISAGASHTCGITTTGMVKCWGENGSGQLGDGTGRDKLIPTTLSGSDTYTRISVGYSHTCGITSGGIAKCWGDNASGQLGDGSGMYKLVPTAVSGSDTYTMISAGKYHTCGLTTAGVVKCWGSNGYGRLGDGTLDSRSTPTTISGSDTYTKIAVSDWNTCGITNSGIAKCWGANANGQLGDGTQTDSSTPIVVSGGDTYTMIAVGDSYTCGITSSGAAKCWGDNYQGTFGDGTTTGKLTPTPVGGSDIYTSISAAGNRTCGVTSVGLIKCWGSNYANALGLGDINTLEQAIVLP